VDKYTWVDKGSSYLPSDMNAAYLWAQLEMAEEINADRMASWKRYYDRLSDLKEQGMLELPFIPAKCEHNAHMFYIKTRDLAERTALIQHLKAEGITAVFHYIPLHTAPAGVKFGRFHGEDVYTTRESERLLRLPMYYGLKEEDIDTVCSSIEAFYKKNVQ
jgi:dTDP-4-amino-4,6-dideoxygalactose transaminase